jgi:flagellar hook-associated protein 3 FlgL
MIRTFSATTEIFLSNLALSKQRSATDLKELSSGYRVSVASDAPEDVMSLLHTQNDVTQTQQVTDNLTRLKSEVDSAESVLENAVLIVQNAEVLAAQALNVGVTTQTMQAMAAQVRDMQNQLVGLTQLNVDGRYVFSGDHSKQPQYAVDTGNLATGVARNFDSADTREITDVSGARFVAAATAQEIFDQTDATGTPTANNVFAALQQLYNGLAAGDPAAVEQTVANIKTSSVWLNNQLAFYGTVQNRIEQSLTIAAKYQTQWVQQTSALRDTDAAATISDLQACQTQQSAALSSQAAFSPRSLFDYLK